MHAPAAVQVCPFTDASFCDAISLWSWYTLMPGDHGWCAEPVPVDTPTRITVPRLPPAHSDSDPPIPAWVLANPAPLRPNTCPRTSRIWAPVTTNPVCPADPIRGPVAAQAGAASAIASSGAANPAASAAGTLIRAPRPAFLIICIASSLTPWLAKAVRCGRRRIPLRRYLCVTRGSFCGTA